MNDEWRGQALLKLWVVTESHHWRKQSTDIRLSCNHNLCQLYPKSLFSQSFSSWCFPSLQLKCHMSLLAEFIYSILCHLLVGIFPYLWITGPSSLLFPFSFRETNKDSLLLSVVSLVMVALKISKFCREIKQTTIVHRVQSYLIEGSVTHPVPIPILEASTFLCNGLTSAGVPYDTFATRQVNTGLVPA